MRLCAGLAVALVLALLTPELQAAEHAEAHGPDWTLLALQILNTAILIAILVRFLRAPLREFLAQRARGIAEAIEQAQKQLAESRREVAHWRSSLEKHARRAREIQTDVEREAQAEQAQVLERARAAAERIREEARAVADQEIRRAQRDLRREASALAVSLAEELLRENLTPDDDRRLVQAFSERAGRHE